MATRFGGGSYMSATRPRLHFGLGPARYVDRVEVTWPSGKRDTYQRARRGHGLPLRERRPETPDPGCAVFCARRPDETHPTINSPAGFWVSILGNSGEGLPRSEVQ